MTCNLPPKGPGHNVREICTRGTRASRKKNDPGHLRRETERAIRRVEQQQDTQWYLKSFEKYPGLLYGPLGGEEHSTGEKILSGLFTALMLVFPMAVAYGGHLAKDVKKISPYLGENFGYTPEQIKIVFLWSEMVREAVRLAQKASPPIGVAEAVDIEEILKDPSKYEKAYKAYDAGMTKKEYYEFMREFREEILKTLRKKFIDKYGDKIPIKKVDDALLLFDEQSYPREAFSWLSLKPRYGRIDEPIKYPDDTLSEIYDQVGDPGILFYFGPLKSKPLVLGKKEVSVSPTDLALMYAAGLSLNIEYDDIYLAPADVDGDGENEILVLIIPMVGKSYRVPYSFGPYSKKWNIDADNKSIPPWYEILEKRMTPKDLGLDGVNYGYETPSPKHSSVPYGSKKTPGYEFSGAVLGAVLAATMRKRSKYPKKRR